MIHVTKLTTRDGTIYCHDDNRHISLDKYPTVRIFGPHGLERTVHAADVSRIELSSSGPITVEDWQILESVESI